MDTAERAAKHPPSLRRNTKKSREETKTRNSEPLVPVATKKIKHNTTPSQININPYIDLFTLISIIQYNMSSFRRKIIRNTKRQKNTIGRDKVIIRARLKYDNNVGIIKQEI